MNDMFDYHNNCATIMSNKIMFVRELSDSREG